MPSSLLPVSLSLSLFLTLFLSHPSPLPFHFTLTTTTITTSTLDFCIARITTWDPRMHSASAVIYLGYKSFAVHLFVRTKTSRNLQVCERPVAMGNRSRTSVLVLSLWASIVVVAAQIPSSTKHFTFPGTSSNESCANVDCQQGTCVPNGDAIASILFPYKCQCNPGWATLQKVVSLLQIPSLPCNVPNCSLNLNCSGDSQAAPPTPSSPISSASANLCLLPGICGHGTCEGVSGGTITSSIKCICDPGYSNVLNTTGGYCLNDCEIKGGCAGLNLTLPGLGSPSPPDSPASDQTAPNTGCSGISFNGGFYVTAILAVMWSFLTSCY